MISALSGPLLEGSIALPLLLGAAVSALAAVAALILIPKDHPESRSAVP